MRHLISEEAEKVLGRKIPVLDYGFVRLVDYYGNDDRIVQAARVSYGEGTKSKRDDAKLIHYLLKNKHTSPFEQVVITIHAKMPIFVARQWVRHRTARLNEMSGRYSVMPSEFYLPSKERLGKQSKKNKQGTDGELTDGNKVAILEDMDDCYENVLLSYEHYINAFDLSRELARIVLPLSVYTEWYWQIDLHNLFHFLKLRLDEHAQWEIRQYALVIAEFAKAVAPVAFSAFEEYDLNAMTLSATEVEKLRTWLFFNKQEMTQEQFNDLNAFVNNKFNKE